jgi:hypothetical protein
MRGAKLVRERGAESGEQGVGSREQGFFKKYSTSLFLSLF